MKKASRRSRANRRPLLLKPRVEQLEPRRLLSLIAPLEPVDPLGSLIYRQTETADLAAAGEIDRFTVELDHGQTVSVVVDPGAALQPALELFGPGNNSLGTATAAALGKDAVLQAIPTVGAGTYSIDVSGAADTTGSYTVQLILNAAVEAESHDGAANDELGLAQDLDPYFQALPGGSGQRAAVVAAQPPLRPIYWEDFESGTAGDAWTLQSSVPTGRIRISDAQGAAGGTYALLMDAGGPDLNINEAVWTVDLAGANDPLLTFYHAEWGDEQNPFLGDFNGSFAADGVAISDDGVRWHPVWDAANSSIGVWYPFSVELAAEAAAAGMTLGEDFRIKFQQYDNYGFPTDGRGYDQIAITDDEPPPGDWYRFSLGADESASLALAVQAAGLATLDLYDIAGQRLVAGIAAFSADQVIDGFTAPDAGEYFVLVTGTDLEYSLTVTRAAAFHTEPGVDPLQDARDITQTGTGLGSVDSDRTLSSQTVEYVIHISVDGLRGDLIQSLVETDAELFSNFKRLQDEGAFTYNARTDYTHTYTLPNHTSLFTGRPVLNPAGRPETVSHNWTYNYDPPLGTTLHNNHPVVDYVASVFDVVHDRGLSTGLFAGKTKFSIFETSYNEIHGAPDTDPAGGDNGRNKIDVSVIDTDYDAVPLLSTFVARMNASPLNYSLVHLRSLDSLGHSYQWGSQTWNEAAAGVDDRIGEILALVENSPLLAGRTALIVTADHGGVNYSHGDPARIENYRVPEFVWGPGIPGGVDLYQLDRHHHDPGDGRPDYNAPLQPIRSGGSGNLALELLGLPPIPASSIGTERADGADLWQVQVEQGDWLTISTETPAGGPAQFDNRLDPALELLDPQGNLVAANDDRAADDPNASLTHDATRSGTYTVRVSPMRETGGEYVLNVEGHGGELPPFRAVAAAVDGSAAAPTPLRITIDFNDAILLSSLQAADVTVDGEQATALIVLDGDTAVFELPALEDGVHDAAIAPGDVSDAQGTPIEAFAVQLVVDTIAPRVVDSSIHQGDVLSARPDETLAVTLEFDEPLRAESLDASDLALLGFSSGVHAPQLFDYEANDLSLTLHYSDLPPDYYTLSLFSGDLKFEDQLGNDLDGEANPQSTVPSGDGIPGGDFNVGFTLQYSGVVGRHVFYGNSAFDAADDAAAIATDKQALRPGRLATFANYTSYAGGINGIMVDLANAPGVPGLDDFRFLAGNSNDPSTWTFEPAPIDFIPQPGAGDYGSERMIIVFADGTLRSQWLEVTVLGGPDVGQPENDVFYFGSAPGETGNLAGDARVDVLDVQRVRNNPHSFFNPATIENAYDFNRDRRVDVVDLLLARSNQTNSLTALKLLDLRQPAAEAAGPPAFEAAPLTHPVQLAWLYDAGQLEQRNRPGNKRDAAARAVDLLLSTWP